MSWIKSFRYYIQDLNMISVLLRCVLSLLAGGILGLERYKCNRSAGMRTYMLVSFGATIAAITGQFSLYSMANVDPTRLASQVISGMGFLGAGSIIFSSGKVVGLTTAAGLWAAGCLGIAIGFGFYELGILGIVFIYIIFTFFKDFETDYIAKLEEKGKKEESSKKKKAKKTTKEG